MPARPRPPTLRLASYNLLHGRSLRSGRVDLDAVAGAIVALQVDVVALQEVDRGQPRSGRVDQLSWLAGALGWHGVFAATLVGDPDRRWRPAPPRTPGGAAREPQPEYGLALLSAWPLSAVRVRRLPGGGAGHRRPGASPQRPGWDREPRAVLSGNVRLPGSPVRVGCTHLSYLPWRGLRQLRVAARHLRAAGGPTVLAGDLNLPGGVARLAAGKAWTGAATDATYPSWRPRIDLDQVLVAGGLAFEDATVAPAATGDHLPVRAVLRLT